MAAGDTDLAARVRRLEDCEAIRQLKAYYARCADEKYTDDHRRKPPEEFARISRLQASVFTEDGVWDGGRQFGTIRGREAIAAHLANVPWTFAMHYFLCPHIVLDGDTARGRWMLWQTCTFAEDELAVFMAATTSDDYVRTPEGWRMARMEFTLKFITRFDRPWSIDRNAPIRR
jgi:hypothetical protein